jgi:hypothetical protein
MKLSEKDRRNIETMAKEAAIRHYRKVHPEASEDAAFRFALRSWRSEEFVMVSIDCLAIWRAIAEAEAAPLN